MLEEDLPLPDEVDEHRVVRPAGPQRLPVVGGVEWLAQRDRVRLHPVSQKPELVFEGRDDGHGGGKLPGEALLGEAGPLFFPGLP